MTSISSPVLEGENVGDLSTSVVDYSAQFGVQQQNHEWKRLEEKLRCFYCSDIMLVVYQCHNGHTTCLECFGKFTDSLCPQCKIEMPSPPIRSLLSEELCSDLIIPCRHCQIYLPYHMMQDHDKTCQLPIIRCYHCQGSFCTKDERALLKHLQESSDVGVCVCVCACACY